ncbi:MAG: NFACT family protein, partial [Bacillota bacterium]
MYKNYFYLNRLITELNELLRGFILLEAFSQERDKLILDFLSSDGDHRFIIISVSQNEPYILLKNDYHRAKKNSISFFRNRLPITLNSVEIATDDRIIKFGFNDCSLFFAIRGKDTNIILLDKDTVHEEFKKISELTEAKLLKDIQGKQYSPYLHKPYFEKNTRGIDFRLLIKDNFPFISKDILSEVYFRAGNKNDFNELCDILSSVIDEIHNEKISVFYDLRLNKVIFAPATFRIYDRTEDRLFETYLSAIND